MDKLNSSSAGSDHVAESPPTMPSGAVGWLMQRAVWITLGGLLLYWIVNRLGVNGLISIGKAGLGLSLVIFIHELGHFMFAKWCDVHVETFSIGFGPAVPGCSFRRGETLYKLALFPLGGYVKMVGEGAENEDGDDDPRSFKNKTVGQRMAIISAGVVMNIIMAAICFILVYNHGVARPAAVVGQVDGGGRAWQKGLPSGAVFQQIGDSRNAEQLYFGDLQRAVHRSRAGEKVKFGYTLPPSKEVHEADIEPRSEKDDLAPIVGLTAANSVVLDMTAMRPELPSPAWPDTPGAAAREAVTLHPGDVVVASTDPAKKGELTPLPPIKTGDASNLLQHDFELAQRCLALAGKKMTLRIQRRDGKVEEVDNAPASFVWGDQVVAATDPDHPEAMKPLEPDMHVVGSGLGDYFDLQRRMQRLAGRFVTLRVRSTEGQERDVWVPPAFHYTLGVNFRMGRVAALREGSPAVAAGLQKGDIIQRIVLTDSRKESATFLLSRKGGEASELTDPLRLPSKLREWAGERSGVKAQLTVLRDLPEQHRDLAPVTLPEMTWDASDEWQYDQVIPIYFSSSEAISELGIAYKVEAVVEEGETAELRRGDVIKEIRLQSTSPKTGLPVQGSWEDIKQDQWAHVFLTMQGTDIKSLGLRVERKVDDSKNLEIKELVVNAHVDGAWPLTRRGLIFKEASRVRQAAKFSEAVVMGLKDTNEQIWDVYDRLRAIATGRISHKSVGGIITISVVAYRYAGMDIWEFLFFLGLISVNLAVLNFLPIPVLDGGHMVFLLYEKIRGRPASETIRLIATYVGIFLILSLMLFVIGQDILRWFF